MKKRNLTQAILLGAAACLLTGGIFWQDRKDARALTGTDSLGQEYDLSTDYLVTQYADATGQHGSFYTIENEAAFYIIDGGWAGNAEAVRAVIAQHGNVVDGWFLSHPHQDHAGALNEILKDPQNIEIVTLYDNSYDYDFISEMGEPYDDISIMDTFYALTYNAPNLVHLHRGDRLDLNGLTVDVYNAFDGDVIANCGDEEDYQNNASLMLMISGAEDRMLFCSDIKYNMEGYLRASLSADQLSCKYIQVGHHGNWSLSEDFYSLCNADVFFFDAPAGITDSPDYPASSFKANLLTEGKQVFDFTTAPNRVVLK